MEGQAWCVSGWRHYGGQGVMKWKCKERGWEKAKGVLEGGG